jgi:hypothetical protein
MNMSACNHHRNDRPQVYPEAQENQQECPNPQQSLFDPSFQCLTTDGSSNARGGSNSCGIFVSNEGIRRASARRASRTMATMAVVLTGEMGVISRKTTYANTIHVRISWSM